LLKRDPANTVPAEEAFFSAIAIAQQQKARSFELRAAMSLARLWRDQGKVQQARELLAPVYGWFTEGFDTRDLKEAKALLEELLQTSPRRLCCILLVVQGGRTAGRMTALYE
jgi:predicted ATPase